MEHEASFLHSQEPTTFPYPELDQSSSCPPPHSHFMVTHFNITFPSTSVSSKWSLSLRFSHQNPVCISLNNIWCGSQLINPLNPKLNPICYLLALLGAHYFLHVSRIRVKSLTFRLLMSYIYGAPILDVSRSHTTTQHSR